MQLLLGGSRHFASKFWISSAFPIFHSVTLWTMIGFTDLVKYTCWIQQLGLACLSVWGKESSACRLSYHITHKSMASPQAQAGLWGGGVLFDVYTVFVAYIFISGIFMTKFWCSVNQETTSILMEMWLFSCVPGHFPQLSLPSLIEAETSSPKGPHSNLDGIKLLWTRQNVFILWVNAIPQISLVTYRLRWWNSTFFFPIIFF